MELTMNNENISDLERKIIRLEENAWFQERKIGELEEHAKELRLRLDALNRQHEGLQLAFAHFQEELLTARGEGMANPPPPHWGQQK